MHGRSLSRVLGLSTAVAALLASAPALAGEWHATPELEVAETYTDNVDLTSTNRQWDIVSRISPGIHVEGKGARSSLNLTYRANYLIFAKSSENTDLRHFLNLTSKNEVVEDFFYFDVLGSVNQQFVDNGLAISSNEDNVTDNRATIQNYSVSPYIKRALGSFADFTARYRFGYVDSSKDANNLGLTDVLSESWTHDATVSLDSGRRFSRLGWTLYGNYRYDDRTGGRRNSERAWGSAELRYTVNHWITVLGSLGYEDINDSSVLSDRTGMTWDLGATLKPGPRTELTLRGGERYNKTNWNARFNYKISDRSNIYASYSEEITSTLRILQDELTGADPGGPVVDPGGFSLVDSAFKRKRVNGGIQGSRGRSTFSADGFYEERRYDVTTTAPENRYGGHARFARRLSYSLTANLTGRYEKTEVKGLQARQDDFYSAQAGLTYAIMQNVSGGLTYFYTKRNSDEASRDLKENAVRINIRATF